MDLRGLSEIEAYRHVATHADIDHMSGRGGQPELTRYIAEAMFDIVAPRKGETIVDVGCGEGSFLMRCHGALGDDADLIGTLPTAEEIERLRGHLQTAAIDLRLGTAEKTGMPAAFADVVVCNSVLLIVPSVPAALREIARIAKPGARIYLGEIPTRDEGGARPSPRWRVVASNTRRFGPAAGAKAALTLAQAAISGRWRELATMNYFHCPPERFTAMCAEAGIEVARHFPWPRLPTERDRPRESYLCRRG